MTDELDLEGSDLSLLETLDHVLNLGLVISGEITISVADIDLIFVGLNVLLGSTDRIEQVLKKREVSGDLPPGSTNAPNDISLEPS
jgi:gas vesicle structural protein